MKKVFQYTICEMEEFLPGVITAQLNNWRKLNKPLRQALVNKIGHSRFRIRFKPLLGDSLVFLYGDVFEIVFFEAGDTAIYKLTHT